MATSFMRTGEEQSEKNRPDCYPVCGGTVKRPTGKKTQAAEPARGDGWQSREFEKTRLSFLTLRAAPVMNKGPFIGQQPTQRRGKLAALPSSPRRTTP
jgi:hypothetical protein